LLDSDGDGTPEPHQHPDNPDDTGPIEEDTGPVCTYPTGPYDFNVNQIVEPMRWSGASAVGAGGSGADLEELYCDPEVSSIFIFVGNTT
jgi:hypothetical protein